MDEGICISGTILGISVAALITSATFFGLSFTDYYTNRFLDTPEKKTAGECYFVAKEIENINESMKENIVIYGKKPAVVLDADYGSIEKNLDKTLVHMDKYIRKEYLIEEEIAPFKKKIQELYTEIENIDQKLLISEPDREDYSERYYKLWDDINDLNYDLMARAVSLEPDVKELSEKIDSREELSFLLGLLGVLVSSASTGVSAYCLSDDLSFYTPMPRRRKNKP